MAHKRPTIDEFIRQNKNVVPGAELRVPLSDLPQEQVSTPKQTIKRYGVRAPQDADKLLFQIDAALMEKGLTPFEHDWMKWYLGLNLTLLVVQELDPEDFKQYGSIKRMAEALLGEMITIYRLEIQGNEEHGGEGE